MRQTLPLVSLVDEAIVAAEQQLGRSLGVERSFEPISVLADAGRLSHALRLAILNAALASSGQVRVELLTSGLRVHIGIENDGASIPPHMAGALGAPFDSRKPPGIGDALGLFVASRLVAELDGELVLVPRAPGARVELRLPRGK
jgi:signal transduction histidine kinase